MAFIFHSYSQSGVQPTSNLISEKYKWWWCVSDRAECFDLTSDFNSLPFVTLFWDLCLFWPLGELLLSRWRATGIDGDPCFTVLPPGLTWTAIWLAGQEGCIWVSKFWENPVIQFIWWLTCQCLLSVMTLLPLSKSSLVLQVFKSDHKRAPHTHLYEKEWCWPPLSFTDWHFYNCHMTDCRIMYKAFITDRHL